MGRTGAGRRNSPSGRALDALNNTIRTRPQAHPRSPSPGTATLTAYETSPRGIPYGEAPGGRRIERALFTRGYINAVRTCQGRAVRTINRQGRLAILALLEPMCPGRDGERVCFVCRRPTEETSPFGGAMCTRCRLALARLPYAQTQSIGEMMQWAAARAWASASTATTRKE